MLRQNVSAILKVISRFRVSRYWLLCTNTMP